MRTALDVHRELLAGDVRHEIVRLRALAASADDLPRVMDLSDGCAAVRCYVPTGGAPGPPLVAVLVGAGTTPDPRAVLRALAQPAAGLRPASPAEVNEATDYAAGLVCPVGLPADVPLLVDEALAARAVLYTAAGEGGVALGIRTRDLLRATGAVVAPLAPGAGPAVLDLEPGVAPGPASPRVATGARRGPETAG